MGTSSEKPKEVERQSNSVSHNGDNNENKNKIIQSNKDKESSFSNIIEKSDFSPKNMLIYHNSLRKKHQSNNLQNNSELNNKAQKYAENLIIPNSNIDLADINLYNGEILGENILISDKEEKTEDICNNWYIEKNNYNYDLNNFQKDTNNFTQLIWKSTKCVGFGCSNFNGKYCYVALYYPAGNILGEFTNNVIKKS